MKRTSHRPAGHPWYPILFGTARIHRAWFGRLREYRAVTKRTRREVGRRMASDGLDPLDVHDCLMGHCSLMRREVGLSVATGPGRLP